jgi:hypothetical protein
MLVAASFQPRPANETSSTDNPLIAVAQLMDERLRKSAPNGFRGNITKERVVKGLIHEVIRDEELVERLFPIIVVQLEY